MLGGGIPFDTGLIFLVAALFFALAVLYSSVGHAGASGYLAVMALFGVPPEMMRPVALTLNILVASLTTFRFTKAGYLSWPDLWPLVLFSIPAAFAGGSLALPGEVYRPVLGVLLLISAGYLIWGTVVDSESFANDRPRIPRVGSMGMGGMVGLLSGLTGIGGGVLLSPALLILRWTSIRRTSAIAGAFILFNSTAGLAGNLISFQTLPAVIPLWAGAVIAGGYLGSRLGAQWLMPKTLIRLLSAALLVAGLKFLFT